MTTMKHRKTQLSVMAVAALAVFAVAAVMLLAGGNAAQATTASLASVSGGGNLLPMATDPTATPRHAPPEPCPDEAAPAVDSGHIALFDVWWNPEELELTNSSCPPTVTHVPGRPRQGSKPAVPARDDRFASSINIDETVIHIPNTHKVGLNETDYPTTKWKPLWDADAKETVDESAPGDGSVWALPACPPGAHTAAANGLCLMFSAALLNDADWTSNIEYRLHHVHQVDIDKQDARYVLVYDGTPSAPVLKWDSSDLNHHVVPVAAGEYDRPMWFFTSRGTYEFQVNITGSPDKAIPAKVSEDNKVSSDVRTYIIHVGAEADLSVGVSAEPALASGDTTLDPGDSVNIQIQATNRGPDNAPETKVAVVLPEGLVSVRKMSSADDYNFSTGVWNVGNLVSGATDNLLLTATVAAGTHGQELAVEATVSATETLRIEEKDENGNTVVREYHVPVPDKVASNNMHTATVTVASSSNVDPIFSVARSVPENTPHQHPVGAPIPVLAGDSDQLTYTLTGNDASSFMVESVATGAQIQVHGSADLDFETKASYQVVLNVTDGKNDAGNPDDSIDSSIAVPISITDVAETVRVTASCVKVGQRGDCTATVSNLPSADTVITYSWTLFDLPTNSWSYVGHNSSTYSVTYNTPGTRKFQVHVTYTDENGKKHYIHSGFPALTWE